jgi:hypothetical protein
MPKSILDDMNLASGVGTKAKTRDFKDTNGRVKSSKRRRYGNSEAGYVITGTNEAEAANAFDNVEIDANAEKDEFDDMIGD